MTGAPGSIPARENQTIGNRYIVGRRLGEGGMGEVYRAVHIGIGRPFAIKFLHAHLARDDEFVSRFQREAQSAGSLTDENIVSVTDFGVAEDGAPYLVMEFLDGDSLSSLLLRHGALHPSRAAHIALQACRGLAHAHAKGIVHRDLKPENLFVTTRNDGADLVKVLDFGIAKLQTSVGLTKTGKTIGTPSYMSPEQTRGERDIDQRTDVYSLGVILYEMLSGERPFPGDDFFQIVHLVQHHEPPPVAEVKPGLPRGLSEVVMRAMARERDDRFPSAVAFLQSLIPFVDKAMTPPTFHDVARGPRNTGQATPATVVDPSSRPTKPATATVRLSRRRRWLGLGIAATVLLVAAAAVVLGRATGQGNPSAARPELKPAEAVKPVPRPLPVPMVQAPGSLDSKDAQVAAPGASTPSRSPVENDEQAKVAPPPPPPRPRPAASSEAPPEQQRDHRSRKQKADQGTPRPRRSLAVPDLDRKNPFSD